MGTAWRNEQPSSGLVGQTQSDEGTWAGSPPAGCLYAGAVGPHQSWRNLSLNAAKNTSRVLGREESLAVPVPAHCGVPQPSDACSGFVPNTFTEATHLTCLFLFPSAQPSWQKWSLTLGAQLRTELTLWPSAGTFCYGKWGDGNAGQMLSSAMVL